jgi:hypothetical protein
VAEVSSAPPSPTQKEAWAAFTEAQAAAGSIQSPLTRVK